MRISPSSKMDLFAKLLPESNGWMMVEVTLCFPIYEHKFKFKLKLTFHITHEYKLWEITLNAKHFVKNLFCHLGNCLESETGIVNDKLLGATLRFCFV